MLGLLTSTYIRGKFFEIGDLLFLLLEFSLGILNDADVCSRGRVK